jgi:uncharacterized protein (TIGR02145 family)
MNKLFLAIICLLAVIELHSQGTMNIHRTTGTVVFINMGDVDSIAYQLTPPDDQMIIYETSGPISYLVSEIDSITYSPGGPTGTAQVCTRESTGFYYYGDVRLSEGSQGDAPITTRGICYGTAPLPDLNDLTELATFPGPNFWIANLNGLLPNTLFYARAFATNAYGTAYGNQVSFNTPPWISPLNPSLSYGSMTDQEGNSYATITIGTQVWMAENLRTNTYANGDPIPNVPDNLAWSQLTTGARTVIENYSGWAQYVGNLYNLYAVNDPRGLCPTGWHVPSNGEWSTLENTVGPLAGQKMKSPGSMYEGTGLWGDTNPTHTNESGFSAIGCGIRIGTNGLFNHWGNLTYLWSSSPAGGGAYHTRVISLTNDNISSNANPPREGLAVRCIMD